MAETKVNLGMLPVNRGEYSSSAKYYKDNIVQYNGSSYVCTVPIGADIDNPAYSQGTAPYTSDPTQLNTGWATFASGNNTFTTGQNVNSIGVDTEPTAGSRNLVESGGVSKRDTRVVVYGNDGVQVSVEFDGLIPNRPYRIVLTPWNYTNAASVSTSAEVFGLYGFLNGSQVAVIQSYTIANKSKVKFVYDVIGNYDALKMFFRIDSGDKVTAEIIDMTNATIGKEGIYNARFGKRYFDLGGYINTSGSEAAPDGYSIYGNSFIAVKPGEVYNIENPSGYQIGAVRYSLSKEWISTLWFGSRTSITIPASCYYIRLMARDDNGLTLDTFSGYISLKYVEKVADATVYDWMLSEAYTIDSVTRTNGDVSSVSVTWLDGLSGTITLTRDTSGNVSAMAGTYNGSTYTINITRNSDGDVTATTKVKS